jgi:uncharacterized protein
MKNHVSLNDQAQLIRCLVLVLENENQRIQVFETHISWVLVAEKFAYKFKKALQFDFLDFSTLQARHFYCQEEWRLNRRLAPDLYLGVVTVTGSAEHPVIDGGGIAIEYAVKMHAFPQQALWSHRIKMLCISTTEIDALARKIGWFHLDTTSASSCSRWGTVDVLESTADDNLNQIASLLKDSEQQQVNAIKSWQVTQHQKLSGLFENRKARGMIKECHGDLHSGNILTLNDRVEVFDCIEFNESLRWIDVINDIAFICMDLGFHERRDLAARLLNQYLEISGDYEGVALLRYYQIQRALIRCKVALLRARQLGADAQDAASHENQAGQYLTYSVESIRPAPTAIMLTHGYSGSGKSTFAKGLVELVGAIQIRSDVERKRMHGLAATSRTAAPPGTGLYDSAVTEETYARLCRLARHIVESGIPVIVDAAFLRKKQRRLFQNLAHDLGVPFFIFDMQASEATLENRITSRAQLDQDPSDAGLDVLAHQIAEHDPLSDEEMKHSIVVECELGMDTETIRKIAAPVMRVLQSSRAS